MRIAIVLLLMCSSAAQAADLYVQNLAEGTTCSEWDPCGSIQYAVEQATSGDVVNISSGIYRENIYIVKSSITLKGESRITTIIESAGGREGAKGNMNNPLDAVIEVNAADTKIMELTLRHPAGNATKRDAAVFAWANAHGLQVRDSIVERNRNKRIDEPTLPGSRGIFILLAEGGLIADNQFRGNYQDHIHLPTSRTLVRDNIISGASRAGISVMGPRDFLGHFNVINDNIVVDSLDDGIHIQGDHNSLSGNFIKNSKGWGIHFCGGGSCYFPANDGVFADNNVAQGNSFSKNRLGEVGDFGNGNVSQ